jgi:hypothetical protein
MSEQTREEWPVDPGFRSKAAEIADAVTWAIHNGYTIDESREPKCCCPLGAVRIKNGEDDKSAMVCYPAFNDISGFVSGFAGYEFNNKRAPYYRLGRAYRKWALERNR